MVKKGVLIGEYGLLKPDLKNIDLIKSKIVPDLITAKKLIDQFRIDGRHVLYLPGSYDLIHIGHAFYIEQAISQYLALPANSSLRESDIIVLVLADDDDLVAKGKASNWIGAGGKEPFRRPVQSETVFRTIHKEENWRLLELASIPWVNMVGFIPSPIHGAYLTILEVITAQKTTDPLKELLEVFIKKIPISAIDSGILNSVIEDYQVLVNVFLKDYNSIITAFKQSTPPWSIQSWQLFIHSYLGFGTFSTPFVRVISHNDSSYKDQVNFIMKAAGLDSIYIADEILISTTELLKKYGHDELIKAKLSNFM